MPKHAPLTGRRILITGGGTGIGQALAGILHRQGNEVIICGRRADKLAETADAHPGMQTYPCDITDDAAVAAMIDDLARRETRISVLVNNAAVLNPYRLDKPAALNMSSIRHDLNTNLLAPIALTNRLLPSLIESTGGMVVNVLSPVGVVPLARFPVYSAGKAALYSYSKSLRRHCRGRLRVVTVFPPSVDTAMFPGGRAPISAEACAHELVRQLKRGSDEIWIGEARYLRILNRLVPGRVFDIVNDYPGMDEGPTA